MYQNRGIGLAQTQNKFEQTKTEKWTTNLRAGGDDRLKAER